MKRVGIVARPDQPEARDVVRELVRWLGARGKQVVLEKETAGLVPATTPVAGKAELPAQTELLVVLGGDGTLLSVARNTGDSGVPILGVNLGGLGFLTATTLDELFRALEEVFAGRLQVEERMLLAARVSRHGEPSPEHVALNDVVINKSPTSRIINLAVAIEGQEATDYRGDGLIIATPTGSTAYSLSAGGPIVFPTMDAVVLTPICAHTLTNRPIVLPGELNIRVTLLTEQQDVMVTMDGQVAYPLTARDTVEIRRATSRVRLLRFPEKHFFSVLRTKLKWGGR